MHIPNLIKNMLDYMTILNQINLDIAEAYYEEDETYVYPIFSMTLYFKDPNEERKYPTTIYTKDSPLFYLEDIGKITEDGEIELNEDMLEFVYDKLDYWGKQEPENVPNMRIELGRKELDYFEHYITTVFSIFIVIGTSSEDLTHIKSSEANVTLVCENGEENLRAGKTVYRLYKAGTSKNKEIFEIYRKAVWNAEIGL